MLTVLVSEIKLFPNLAVTKVSIRDHLVFEQFSAARLDLKS